MTDRLRQVVSEHLVSAGFYECRNPSLESPKMSAWLGDAGDSITLSNWATREMSVLRRTLAVGPGDHRANQRPPRGAVGLVLRGRPSLRSWPGRARSAAVR